MIKLIGPWVEGYAFDIHTICSEYTGNNEFGHPTFDTKRSAIGQCLYDLKYGQHQEVISEILKIIKEDEDFLKFISKVNVILPVPPSNQYRRIQPVQILSKELAKEFDLIINNALSSTNKEELKNVPTKEKYNKIKKSIKISGNISKDKNILIFDDVYDSGSTLNAITNVIIENGYKNVYIFTLTKTRKAD